MALIAVYRTINKILQDKDWSFVTKNGLEKQEFHNYEEHFDFIQNHVREFGNVPDKLTFLNKFPDFEIMEVGETDECVLKDFREEDGYHRFVPFLQNLMEYTKQDTRIAYDYLIDNISKVRPKTPCKGVNIIAQALERYELFKNRSIDPDKMTIKSGLTELDEIFGGWEYGDELVTIIARTNQGKSWLLMKFLAEAFKQGKKVGLYSGEMNHIKLGYRLDALIGHFSNRGLSNGAQTDGYQEYINKLTEFTTPFTIITQKEYGGRPTVSKIRNFIEENEIEIMGIDQFSLMEDGRASMRDPTRLRMAHVAEDLFLLSSEYKIPILGLAQANRDAAKKEGDMDAPGLENIKECDDISHNSSKCIGMKQSSFGLVLDIIKNREGKVGDKLLYSWDIDTGHFSYIPSAGDAAMPQTRQQFTQQDKQAFASPTAISPF